MATYGMLIVPIALAEFPFTFPRALEARLSCESAKRRLASWSLREPICRVSQFTLTNRFFDFLLSISDVLVLGAGVAGVTAAQALKKAGLNVKVLEGRDVPGGRVRTDYKRFSFPSSAPANFIGKNIPVDLGGSWIHGVQGGGNPIYSLAQLAKSPVVKSRWERTALFNSDGSKASEAVLLWWMKMMSDVTDYFEEELEDPNMSISEALDDYLQINNFGNEELSTDEVSFPAIRASDSDSEDDFSASMSSEGKRTTDSHPAPAVIPPQVQKALVRIALVIAGEWEWAERMEVLSARNSFQDGEQLGADVMMPEGYWTIFQRTFMKEFESNTIDYNSKVSKVTMSKGGSSSKLIAPSNQNSSPTSSRAPLHNSGSMSSISSYSGPVTVSTTDGREFVADHVICTLPLGVLKRDDVKFNPALSDHKSVSIARLGYGTMNKIWVQFERAFWEEGSSHPSHHSSSADGNTFGLGSLNSARSQNGKDDSSQSAPSSPRSNASSGISRPSSPRLSIGLGEALSPHCLIWMNEKGDGRLTVGVNFNVVVPHSNILCVMSTGESVPAVERMSDEEVLAELMTRLRRCYGSDIPEPCNHLITRWSTDEWSYGSYSSLILGSTHDDLKELARAEGKLHFAGEHTNTQYVGSVHGAYISGMRAATEVLTAVGKPAPTPHKSFEPEDDLKEE